jgi:hypothetical protein
VFLPDGALLYATTAAQEMLGRNTSLAALDVMPLAATAHAAGKASGATSGGSITLERIGMDTSAVLLATLTRSEKQAAPIEPPPAQIEKTEAPVAIEPVAVPELTAQPVAEAPVAPPAPEIEKAVPPLPASRERERTACVAAASAQPIRL